MYPFLIAEILQHNPPFTNPLSTRLTGVKDIPYYVSDKFLRIHYRDRYQLAQVERMVERAYEEYLVEQCTEQHKYKAQLQQAASQRKLTEEERKRLKQRANEFQLKRCEELEALFPRRNKQFQQQHRKQQSQRYRVY